MKFKRVGSRLELDRSELEISGLHCFHMYALPVHCIANGSLSTAEENDQGGCCHIVGYWVENRVAKFQTALN